MNTYTITYKLLNGIHNTIKVETDSINETLKTIEDTFDEINTPLEDIDYEPKQIH